MFYEYLNKIKDFLISFFNSEAHAELWNDLGPI